MVAVGNLAWSEQHSPDANPINAPLYVSSRLLAAGVAESITVPANAAYVRLAGTADFFIAYSATAVVPGDVDDGTSNELIKANGDAVWRSVKGLTALSVISSGTPIVTASFYGL